MIKQKTSNRVFDDDRHTDRPCNMVVRAASSRYHDDLLLCHSLQYHLGG